MKISSSLLVLALLIISVYMQCASCTSCWANESYISAVCYPPLERELSNITEPIPLVPAGRSECTNFTDFGGITAAGRTAAGVIVAIVGSLAQFSGFVIIKFCYKNESVIKFCIFQWIMSISMWLVGMVVNFAVAGQPIFYYFSTTGGILLSLGLLLVLSVINQFGIAVPGVIISTTLLIANWITNQYGLCVQCSNSVACIISVLLLFISVLVLFVVAIVKSLDDSGLAVPWHGHDNDRASELAPPFDGNNKPSGAYLLHDHDRAQRLPLSQQESSMSRGAFPEPKPMSNLTPATPIHTKGGHTSKGYQKIVEEGGGNKSYKIPLIKSILGTCAIVLIGLCWGWQFVSINFLKKCDDSSLFSCNLLAYLFGHLSGSLVFTSLMLIVLAIVKLLCSRCVRAVPADRPEDRPSIKLIAKMIIFAVLAGVLWGIGLVGQLAAESMISPGLATPITAIAFALSTSTFAIKEILKLRTKIVLLLLFGLSLLFSIIAMSVYIVGYTT